MGIKGLHAFLRSKDIFEQKNLNDLKGKVVAVDLFIYLVPKLQSEYTDDKYLPSILTIFSRHKIISIL